MVTVDERHRGQLEAVAGQLESAGMSVADKFVLGGVIVGKVARGDLAKLHAVAGIKAIEEEPTFHSDY
jgi:hypothetical protein